MNQLSISTDAKKIIWNNLGTTIEVRFNNLINSYTQLIDKSGVVIIVEDISPVDTNAYIYNANGSLRSKIFFPVGIKGTCFLHSGYHGTNLVITGVVNNRDYNFILDEDSGITKGISSAR